MKIQSPWMGRIKGSAGNMTGCKVYDKNVMRAKAFEVSNPNTQAQQTQRNYFASLTNLVGTFTDEQLRTLFPQKPKAMSRRNALTKQLALSNTTEGTTKSIDFADITTLGNAPTMDFGETQLSINDGNSFAYLDAKVKSNTAFANLQFVVAIVNETKGQIILPESSNAVSNGQISFETPNGWESTDNAHAIPMITNIKTTDAYHSFGSFIIKVRPEK